MNETRFALRTIRNGRIRLAGRDWVPDDRSFPYDGRLDGQRMAFSRYRRPRDEGGYEDFLSLWGSEHAYRCPEEECGDLDCWPGPNCIDGVFRWVWWGPA